MNLIGGLTRWAENGCRFGGCFTERPCCNELLVAPVPIWELGAPEVVDRASQG
jgi:hypothetical protein